MLDPMEVFQFTQNKLFEIHDKSNSLQLFKIRSQSTAMSYCQPYLERGLHICSCIDVGSTGSCLAGCGFSLVYLKPDSKGQILHLALEILSEELNGLLVHSERFSPSVAHVMLMRYSILHDHFMILYTKRTIKTKHNPSVLMLLAFNQEVMTIYVCWSGIFSASPEVLLPVAADVHLAPDITLLLGVSLRWQLQKLSQLSGCTSLHWLGHKAPFLIPYPSFCKDLAVAGRYRLGPV